MNWKKSSLKNKTCHYARMISLFLENLEIIFTVSKRGNSSILTQTFDQKDQCLHSICCFMKGIENPVWHV